MLSECGWDTNWSIFERLFFSPPEKKLEPALIDEGGGEGGGGGGAHGQFNEETLKEQEEEEEEEYKVNLDIFLLPLASPKRHISLVDFSNLYQLRSKNTSPLITRTNE